jgi:hypothetical protein
MQYKTLLFSEQIIVVYTYYNGTGADCKVAEKAKEIYL